MFLHGLGSTKENWYPQLDHFRKTHFAVAWDARGYGESHDYEGELAFARDFVNDLTCTLDLLGAGRAHLVGLSMGGMIAQCFYFRHPRRVASLVLAHTFPSFRALGEQAVADFLAARLQPLLNGATPADLAPAAAASLLAPDAPQSARVRLMASLSDLRKASYIKTIRALAAQDALGELKDIAIPSLVLAGELDRLSPISVAQEMSKRIPGAQLVVIPEAGHLSNLERPEQFNEAVGAFLSIHAGTATELK